MKKIFVKVTIGLVILIISGSYVLAGKTYAPGIQDRIFEQEKRIDQGITSGSLTRHEAAVLTDNLNWIRSKKARLKRDGLLTRKERLRLHRMLDRNSDMIYKKKHNPIIRLYP